METPQLSYEAQKLCNKFHLLMEEAQNCKDEKTIEWMIGRALQIVDEIRSMGHPATASFHFNGERLESELEITIPVFQNDEDKKNYDAWFAETNGIAIDD